MARSPIRRSRTKPGPRELRHAPSRRHLYVTSYTDDFSHFVTSMTAPVASGWSVPPGRICNPLESAAFDVMLMQALMKARRITRRC